MSDSPESGFKIKIPHLSEEFDFDSPQKLSHWIDQIRNEWQWLNAIPPVTQAWADQDRHLRAIKSAAEEWMRYSNNSDVKTQTKSIVQSGIQQLFEPNNPLFGNLAASALIKKVKQDHGDVSAAGLFAVLTHCVLRFDNTVSESFFSGIIRGFLFQNEIEWTATAHHKVLEDLEYKYKQRIADQEARLQQLEAANKELNDSYDTILKDKSTALDELKTIKTERLDELHKTKDEAFTDLASRHESNLKAIEDTFHNKLALQKPVDYWDKKCKRHVQLATRFAISSAITLIVLGAGLSYIIYWAFGHLGENENPKHWQVGIAIVAAFFVVWVVRILVRLFLSHQHLASDASERVTMVQTYLSLSREGEAGVAATDRTIILQQLFKSASDGIVKDDAAPPGFLELASRQK